MKEILIFGGTTEGRKLSEHLAASGISHTVCVATEYGEMVLKENPFTKVHQGRMNQGQVKEYIENGKFLAVVDATHPYADMITENLKTVMQGMDIPYFRLKREIDMETPERKLHTNSNVVYFGSSEECGKALEAVEGNILLTTGSKELEKFCVSDKVRQSLYVRVLPGMESLMHCMNQGIGGKQILALQGPFTTEMNEAIIHQYQIKCLVTKASGKCGGYPEKLEAANRAGILAYVIGHPKEDKGDSFHEVCLKLEALCKQKIQPEKRMEIVLAGIGMGSRNNHTKEVCQTIENADILLGAERMIADYYPRLDKQPFYQAKQIIPYLKKQQEREFLLRTGKVVILFSGDSGFYSGCQSLYQELCHAVESGELNASVRVMPGISCVAYLAACIGESWHDAAVYSMHGKELPNLARKIKGEKKTFLLLSGATDINQIGRLLLEEGMNECEIFVGYQLSYPWEQISLLTPKECMEVKEEGLYTCCIKNPHPNYSLLTHGMADEEFIRDKVPMTKEEVREVSICKMRLRRDSIVYDIGSGTGSIAIEIAGLSDEIQVFAIERKEEAAALINRNREKFRLENITVVTAEAPAKFSELPMPTHALIGGSGGRLKEILSALYQKNSKMRVVIHAISMETICEIKDVLSLFPIEKEEIVQIQVSRSRQAGSYHLMQAENPVWICAFDFCRRQALSNNKM